MATIPPVQYKDPVLKTYVDLITSKTDAFKSIYYGDPIRIPASNLPALIVSKTMTDMTEFQNSEDEHNMQIIFTVVTDIRKDISDDKTMAPGTNSLYYLLEGRNTDLTLRAESLAYILRHNVDVNQGLFLYTDVGSKTRISYAMTVGKRAEDQFGIEGSITIVAKLIQLR